MALSRCESAFDEGEGHTKDRHARAVLFSWPMRLGSLVSFTRCICSPHHANALLGMRSLCIISWPSVSGALDTAPCHSLRLGGVWRRPLDGQRLIGLTQPPPGGRSGSRGSRHHSLHPIHDRAGLNALSGPAQRPFGNVALLHTVEH